MDARIVSAHFICSMMGHRVVSSLALGNSTADRDDKRELFPLEVSPMTAIIGRSMYFDTFVVAVNLSINARISSLPWRLIVNLLLESNVWELFQFMGKALT
jgi:hypothetical protein